MSNISYSKVCDEYHRLREGYLPEIENCKKTLKKMIQGSNRKIVVLDDDPTGVQSVHGVCVLTGFEKELIREGFLGSENLFFILTNSRALTESQTRALHTRIGETLMEVSGETGIPFLLLSRGDSTLRGHYPLETAVLKETLEENGSGCFDGEILVPFFAAGGRLTVHNIHYVRDGDELIPAGETEFAKDLTFGYLSSDLRMYIEEKTKGVYLSKDTVCISLEELRKADVEGIAGKLRSVTGFGKVIVNALDDVDLQVFCLALYRALEEGKQFLFRCAADFVKELGGIAAKDLLSRRDMITGEEKRGGIIIIGSHTEKTTRQLEQLKGMKGLVFLEFNSDLVLEDKLEGEIRRVTAEAEKQIAAGISPVIYTRRKLLEIEGDTREQALLRSVKISEGVQRLVGDLKVRPAFVIAKGGITSSDVGVKALKVRKAMVLGQAQPGVPVWKTGAESKFPGIPYIIFPGNVGNDDTLRKVVEELQSVNTERKIIISVAPVAGPDPLLPELLSEDVAECVKAGAGMCHLHCKNREGRLTPDTETIIEAFEQIRKKTDVVIQASSGGISEMTIAQRCYPLTEYKKVESASLNGGSTNLGEAIYRNSFEDIRYCAGVCYEKEIIPEIEVFDIGMIHNIELVRKEQPFRSPVLFNLVFGHIGGMQPTIEALTAFRSFVPGDCLWGVTHFGRDNWTFLAAAIAMGAAVVRIGFEDSRYLEEGTNAELNCQLVERLRKLIHAMGLEAATPEETRRILGIIPKE